MAEPLSIEEIRGLRRRLSLVIPLLRDDSPLMMMDRRALGDLLDRMLATCEQAADRRSKINALSAAHKARAPEHIRALNREAARRYRNRKKEQR